MTISAKDMCAGIITLSLSYVAHRDAYSRPLCWFKTTFCHVLGLGSQSWVSQNRFTNLFVPQSWLWFVAASSKQKWVKNQKHFMGVSLVPESIVLSLIQETANYQDSTGTHECCFWEQDVVVFSLPTHQVCANAPSMSNLEGGSGSRGFCMASIKVPNAGRIKRAIPNNVRAAKVGRTHMAVKLLPNWAP